MAVHIVYQDEFGRKEDLGTFKSYTEFFLKYAEYANCCDGCEKERYADMAFSVLNELEIKDKRK